MRASVRENFVPFTQPLEGVIFHFYNDVLGLTTIGLGNLVDPVETALALRMVHKGTDIPATPAEIRYDWLRVKNDPNAARLGHRSVEALTQLRLTKEGLEDVVGKRLALNEQVLRKRFPQWEEWPADAQLATMSLAWACGPAFNFVALAKSLLAQDWTAAAEQCRMRTEGNPGLIPRNAANKALYLAAASHGRDEELVSWHVLTAIDARLWPELATAPANDVEPTEAPFQKVYAPLDWGSPTDRDPDDAA